MNILIAWATAHPYISGIAAFHILSNAIGAMEPPTEKDGKAYRFVYRFGHSLAGNVKYALRSKFPDMIAPDDKQP